MGPWKHNFGIIVADMWPTRGFEAEHPPMEDPSRNYRRPAYHQGMAKHRAIASLELAAVVWRSSLSAQLAIFCHDDRDFRWSFFRMIS